MDKEKGTKHTLELGEDVYTKVLDLVGDYQSIALINDDAENYKKWRAVFDDCVLAEHLKMPLDNDKIIAVTVSSETLEALVILLAYSYFHKECD